MYDAKAQSWCIKLMYYPDVRWSQFMHDDVWNRFMKQLQCMMLKHKVDVLSWCIILMWDEANLCMMMFEMFRFMKQLQCMMLKHKVDVLSWCIILMWDEANLCMMMFEMFRFMKQLQCMMLKHKVNLLSWCIILMYEANFCMMMFETDFWRNYNVWCWSTKLMY